MREALGQVTLRDLRGVEQHVGRAVAFHHGVDGAGHDVARGEVAQRMEVLHERPPGQVAQDGTFAADRLGDEGAAAIGRLQRRRVELHHLHVADLGARAVGHGDAVAGGDVRVGRKLVDLSDAASREDHDRGGERLDLAGLRVQDVEAERAVARSA